MPIKKDESGKRWVEMELVVPGTPEQVWQAMATGPGYTAWFTPTQIEERVGGAIRFDLGEMGSSTGEVTAWEPPFRFAYVEREWGEGAPPLATEVTVTARSGGRCVVRMVHSLFASTDDWDDQMEGFEGGWPGFFQVLRLYLEHFAGMPAACASAMAEAGDDGLRAWKRLTGRLGLAGADVGEAVELAQGPEKLSGTVEFACQDGKQRYIVLRLDAPGPGVALIGTFAMGGGANASLAFYRYGEDAEQAAAAAEPQWRAWLGETFARS